MGISFEGVAFDDTSVDHVPILLPTRPRPWTEDQWREDEKPKQSKISATGADDQAVAASGETDDRQDCIANGTRLVGDAAAADVSAHHTQHLQLPADTANR